MLSQSVKRKISEISRVQVSQRRVLSHHYIQMYLQSIGRSLFIRYNCHCETCHACQSIILPIKHTFKKHGIWQFDIKTETLEFLFFFPHENQYYSCDIG